MGEARLDTVVPTPEAAGFALRGMRRCVFCCEEIQPSASICPHCRSNLVPLQRLSDEHAALAERVIALEQDLAALRQASSTEPATVPPAIAASADPVPAPTPGIKWPHLADNIFLGLVVLITAHWLATTLPTGNRALFRLVALIVALPFGYRFERHTKSGVTEQVIAALGYGSFGTIAIGLLDMAVGTRTPQSLSAQDIIATVAAISLSHFAGSALAQARQGRADRAALAAAALSGGRLPHLEAARIKSTAETVKALYEAVAPIVAGAAAVWAACSHILS
jgi:hypothetical protein